MRGHKKLKSIIKKCIVQVLAKIKIKSYHIDIIILAAVGIRIKQNI